MDQRRVVIAVRGHGAGDSAAAPVPTRLSWEQALAWRMRRHRLVERAAPDEAVQVVERLCGLHAQVLSCAELTLWARVEGLERGALEAALWEQRTLVKLWAMRGTLHLLSSRELGLWAAALSSHERYGEIGRAEFAELVEAVGHALDGEPLTREQLALEVERRSGAAQLGRLVLGSWGMGLKPASLHGRLCFAPSDGRRVRFAAPRAWLGGELEPVDREVALAAVARRFLRAFAPATVEEVARGWGGGTLLARRMLAALGDELAEVAVDGEPRWMLADDLPDAVAAEATRSVHLLPGFDQWTIGAPRGVAAALDPRRHAQVYRPQGWISPVVLVDGRIAGVWRHARGARRLRVEVEPFGRPASRVRAGVEAEAARLASFHERELELRWQP